MRPILLIAALLSVAAQAQLGLYSVKLFEPDLEKAAAFYSILGFEKGRQFHDGDVQELVPVAPAAGARIHLIHDVGSKYHMVPGGGSILLSVTDVEAAVASLRKHGFTIAADPHETGPSIVAIAADPGGNRVEITSRKVGSRPL